MRTNKSPAALLLVRPEDAALGIPNPHWPKYLPWHVEALKRFWPTQDIKFDRVIFFGEATPRSAKARARVREIINAAAAPAHPVTELSFVSEVHPDGPGRCFWSIERPSDPYEESRLGGRLGLEYLKWETKRQREAGYHPLLPPIIDDMPRKLGHAEIGFLTAIGYAASRGLHETQRIHDFWESKDSEAA
jgi:hypothetical protein